MKVTRHLILILLSMFIFEAQSQIQLELEGVNADVDLIRMANNDYSRIASYTASNGRFEIPTFIGFRSRGSILSPSNVAPLDRIRAFMEEFM